MDHKDISHELWREYYYTEGHTVRIEKPKQLFIAGLDRGHRVFDGRVVTYVPPGWLKLCWEPRDKSKPVMF